MRSILFIFSNEINEKKYIQNILQNRTNSKIRRIKNMVKYSGVII